MKNLILIFIAFFMLSCDTTEDNFTITDLGKVFVSSDNRERITVFDFSDLQNITSVEFVTTTDSAAGLYYDAGRDVIYEADKENNRINAYDQLSRNEAGSAILPDAIGTSDFTNPRGMSSEGNIAIVSQYATDENNQQNALVVYDVAPNSITLRKSHLLDFPVWDIQLVGNTLYAIQDQSDSLAVFNSILERDNGNISPDFKISIDGTSNLKGLFYDLESDLMLITDAGNNNDASEDGAIHIIEDFSFKLSDALQESDQTISATEQLIIEGSNTNLTHPVDVILRREGNLIIVADRNLNGGSILVFDYPVQTDNSNTFDVVATESKLYNSITGFYINQ